MFRRIWDFANETMPHFNNLRSLIWWVSLIWTLGVTFGVATQHYIVAPMTLTSGGGVATIAESGSRSCDVIFEISRVQAAYESQISPVRQRWLDLTAELERGDTLTLDRERLAETADLVRSELTKLRQHHQDIITGLTKSCVTN